MGIKFFAVLVIVFLSQSTYADLSNEALFSKCYSLLVNEKPLIKSELYQNVKNNNLDPIEACTNLLGDVKMDRNGRITKWNSLTHRSIFQNFQNLHISWFTNLNFASTFRSTTSANRSHPIFDQSEPALYYSRALFKPGVESQSILTYNKTLRALRLNNGQVRSSSTRVEALTNSKLCSNYSFQPCEGDPSCQWNCRYEVHSGISKRNIDNSAMSLWQGLQFQPIGSIVGIVNQSGLNIKVHNSNGTQVLRTRNVFEHSGGGVLGSPMYRMTASNSPAGDKFTSKTVARSFAKAVLKDFLCRELPVIRYFDAQPFVVDNSDYTFRRSQTCVQCHVTSDRMAGVLRNHRTRQSTAQTTSEYSFRRLGAEFIDNHPVNNSLANTNWSAFDDPNYHRRPPLGQLFYRSYDGQLQFAEVKSVADLGKELTQRDDFYICLAKRYYQHFTGISAITTDIKDPAYTYEMTDVDHYYREQVIRLGLDLKQHQNIKTLIGDILNTDVFKEISLSTKRELAHE